MDDPHDDCTSALQNLRTFKVSEKNQRVIKEMAEKYAKYILNLQKR